MNISALLWPNHPYVKIFGLEIYWYAIIIVCGMIAAYFVISLLFKRRNMSSELFTTYFIITLPVAILCTRAFYCITDGMPIAEWFNFKSIREGGLSIIGGVIGGTASVIVISLVKKVDLFRAGDCIVVGLLLAQSIGRWGNFVNQEVYGAEVTNAALQWFPFAVYIESTQSWHYAFFFYESLANFTVAVLLFINAWKNAKKPNGVNMACYFIAYGLVRSIMEPLRDKEFILGEGVRWSQVMSLCMLIGGLGLLIFVLWNNRRKEGTLFGSLKNEPYGISEYIGDSKDEVAYFDKWNMMCRIYPEKYVVKTEESAQTAEEPPKEKREVQWRAVETEEKEEKEEKTEESEQ